jgi:hypothetical protein
MKAVILRSSVSTCESDMLCIWDMVGGLRGCVY